jgi:AraC-like DNA-binding protein
MDALAGFLEGPRARRAFLLRSLLEPPWSLRIEDEAPLTVIVLLRGLAWLVPDDEPACELRPGDVAIVRGPAPYTVADDPATVPQVVILPGERCTTPEGESLSEVMDLGVRTWGNSPTGSVMMLTGTYQTDGEVSRRLLDALPDRIVLRGDTWTCPVVPLLVEEVAKNDPGQEVVLDRLLDVLLVDSLKAWFSRPESNSPRWYRAHGDPVVGEALRLLQHQPALPWTVASLAAACGVSRAALARRFNELVGEPPMAFLTGWRLALAADLLLEQGASVSSVSRDVGYGSPFTLSTAFKRVYGVSPREHRDRHRREYVA